MDRTVAVVLCSVLLLVAEIQGAPNAGRGRCLCTAKGSDFLPAKSLAKLEVFPKSSSCERLEIIATLKDSKQQRCLNPDSKWVQKTVKNLIKNKSKRGSAL
ncbi:PREDICTED: C-X-C motif chemokine 10-like [Crocodylus porosus]|uniref:C-X-C motif chemokine ligand 10 n=1 Tax=Crocodylus porosus TaxID=8502 RepID=A0A7M4EGV4_CROPO|nr:PREDICTED: C-X-C motif chemokine 10-like [Crocodylus porosus]